MLDIAKLKSIWSYDRLYNMNKLKLNVPLPLWSMLDLDMAALDSRSDQS